MTAPLIGEDGTWDMPPGAGPCRTWPAAAECSPLDADPAKWTAEQRNAVEVATEILWRLTAGRFGLCQETIRPCQRRYLSCPPDANGVYPRLIEGRWHNLTCGCGRRGSCSCDPPAKIDLPGPVFWSPAPDDTTGRVDTGPWGIEVWIDGEKLPEGSLLLLNQSRLLRTDGQGWPDYQHLDRPLTEHDTFGIRYWRGTPVPPGGRRALAALAWELVRACQGDQECRLPDRVREISREGITMTMVDPQEFLTEGRTGITEIDLWLSTVNPTKQRSPSAVWSPDLPQQHSDPYGQVPR